MVRSNWVSRTLLPLLTVAMLSTQGVSGAVEPPRAATDTVGLVDPATGRWYLRDAAGDVLGFYFGDPGDQPFLGDWDCDGTDTPGLYRRSDGYVYLRNSNTSGVAHVRFFFGDPGDFPLAGDFDGDGCDTVSLYRPATGRVYVVNRLGSGERGLGAADAEYPLGDPGDMPFAGDFDGDGVDTFGALRPADGRVFLRNRHGAGAADVSFTFGDPGDLPVIGAWGGGADAVGVYRPAHASFYFRNGHGNGPADAVLSWGEPSWLPVSGNPSGAQAVRAAAAPEPPAPVVGREAAASPADPPPPAEPPPTEPPPTEPPPAEPPPADPPPADPPPAEPPPAEPPPADPPPADPPPATEPPPADPPPAEPPPAAEPPPENGPTDTVVYVGEDLQAAVDANPPGATFTIKTGVHRLQQVVPKDGQTFVGEAGAVLSGARLLDGFTRQGPAWVVDGQDQEGQVHGECAPVDGEYYAGCRYPEDLFIDDEPLWQVTDLADLAPGRWFFDYAADRIYLADDPTGRRVEVSVARHAFTSWRDDGGDHYPDGVTIRNLVVEKYANPAQHGAIHAGGFDDGGPGQGMTTGWAIVDSEIRLNHGAGIRTGHETLIAGSSIHHNGQLGVRARGRDVVIAGSEIAHNNHAAFEMGWEAGGVKAMYTTGLVVRDSNVHDNRGFGLWTDTDNVDTTYEANTVAGNRGAGIFHEASYAAVVRGNTVTGNGHGTDGWFYGSGILIAHSSDVEVAGNVVSGNADGIGGVQQARGPHRLDNLWVHDNHVELSGGLHGVGEDIGDPAVFDRNLRFEGNTYAIDPGATPFAWDNLYLDMAGWQAYGHDAG